MKVRDTLSNQLVELEPISPPRINMFVCGPTVYDHAHIGHARTFIAFDIIARYLRHRGYDLFYIMNITDIDDKIIKKAREEESSWEEIARKYETSFLHDMRELGLTYQITLFARATDYIDQMIKQIQQLIDRGYAYVTTSGVYYRVSKFEQYGKLAKVNVEELQAGARVDIDREKEDPRDFVLWKFRDPSDKYEPAWDSPWGPGRPGWHIEDTAITEANFGPQYDLHGGAIELIFPHHEAEIAQMEGASGKHPLVRYWLHTGLLNIGGEKMSKSLKNFIPIKEAIEQWGKNTIRMFIASAHYRNPIDYTPELLSSAKAKVERISRFLSRLDSFEPNNDQKHLQSKEIAHRVARAKEEFIQAMDNDFNTPEALSAIFSLIRDLNKALDEKQLTQQDILTIRQVLVHDLLWPLGIEIQTEKKTEDELTPKVMKLLISIRQELRKKKDFRLSDMIRDELKVIGIHLEDKGSTTTWRKIMSK